MLKYNQNGWFCYTSCSIDTFGEEAVRYHKSDDILSGLTNMLVLLNSSTSVLYVSVGTECGGSTDTMFFNDDEGSQALEELINKTEMLYESQDDD